MTVRWLLTRTGDFPQFPELPPGFEIVRHSNPNFVSRRIDLTYHPFHHALSLGLGHTATREEAVVLAWDSFREIDEEWYAWISALRVVLDNSMDLPLDELGLPKPVVKTLNFQGVQSLHGLARLTFPELLKMPNIGRRSIHKIQEVLARHNLKLNSSMPEIKSSSKCICGVLMDVVCTACGTYYCDVCDGNFCRACTVKTLEKIYGLPIDGTIIEKKAKTMKVNGVTITQDTIESVITRMKSGEFTLSTIESIVSRAQNIFSRSTINRAADRIIQQQRKAGNIIFDGKKWMWTGKP